MIYFSDRIILDPTYPEVVKEFIFIYAFGYFSLYYELYAKFTEIDGTGNLQTNYQQVGTEEESDEEEEQQHTKQVINFDESNGARI